MSFVKHIILTLLLIVVAENVNAQCYNFAKKVGKAKLGDYVHDGNYNATILSEGEKAEMFKTFFEGQKYRISICKIKSLPPIHFKLVDQDGNVLFDNQKHDYILSWDFEVKSTQMLIIEVEVLQRNAADDVISGCVSVLFGVEPDRGKHL